MNFLVASNSSADTFSWFQSFFIWYTTYLHFLYLPLLPHVSSCYVPFPLRFSSEQWGVWYCPYDLVFPSNGWTEAGRLVLALLFFNNWHIGELLHYIYKIQLWQGMGYLKRQCWSTRWNFSFKLGVYILYSSFLALF